MYISTDQILPIQKIDDSSIEIKNLLSILKTHTEAASDDIVSSNKTMDDSPQQIHIGTIIDGKYKIVSALGQGCYCQVFLAINEKTNKSWAIKVIPKNSKQYSAFIQNLSTEISLLNNLNHPGIPAIIDIIDTKTYLLIVMDYIEGASLSRVISESGAQSEEVVLQWAIQLSETYRIFALPKTCNYS
ncbi:MAG: protein kinase [Clostridia bacterium]|nr:protein kinase [Clostridia bacterium]